MADGNRAEIEVGIAGVGQAISEGKRLEAAWKSIGGTISEGFKGAASDILRTVQVIGMIDFGKALTSGKQFREDVQRLAVFTGSKFGEVEKKIFDTSKATLEGADAVAQWTKNLYRASDTVRAFSEYGVLTGRTLAEMTQTATTFSEAFNVQGADATERFLGRIVKIAKDMGTTGGPRKLEEQLNAVGGAATRVSLKTEKDQTRFVALMAALGKGLTPEQAKIAQSEVIGHLVNQEAQVRHYMGKGVKTRDEQGLLLDPLEIAKRYQEKIRAGAGSEENARFHGRLTFGTLGGAALMNVDFAKLEREAKTAQEHPDVEQMRKAQDTFRASAAGKEKAAEIKRRQREQEIGDKAAPYISGFKSIALEHPIAMGAGYLALRGLLGGLGNVAGSVAQAGGKRGGALGALASAGATPVRVVNFSEAGIGGLTNATGGLTNAVGNVVKSATGTGGAGAVAAEVSTIQGTLAGLAGMVAAGVGAGIAGAFAGHMLDEKFGISDKIAGVNDGGKAIAERDQSQFANREYVLKQELGTARTLAARVERGEITGEHAAREFYANAQRFEHRKELGETGALLTQRLASGVSSEELGRVNRDEGALGRAAADSRYLNSYLPQAQYKVEEKPLKDMYSELPESMASFEPEKFQSTMEEAPMQNFSAAQPSMGTAKDADQLSKILGNAAEQMRTSLEKGLAETKIEVRLFSDADAPHVKTADAKADVGGMSMP